MHLSKWVNTNLIDLPKISRFTQLVFLAITLIAACSERQINTARPLPAGTSVGFQRIFIATNRLEEPGRARFGGERADRNSYIKYDISIPRDHEDGQLEWSRAEAVNPQTDFSALNEATLSRHSFQQELNSIAATRVSDEREVVIYVHGFNVTYAKSVYRMAQLAEDSEFAGIPIAFSWPSKGKLLGYVHDRDSTIISRNGLEELIETVETTDIESIILVGHSLGSYLVMETLRQIAIRRGGLGKTKITGVILFSPDIDIEVFTSQAKQIGKLPRPFFLFSSQRDIALSLSGLLSGKSARLGRSAEFQALTELGVSVFDTTRVRGGDFLRHNTAATSPLMTKILRNLENYMHILEPTILDRDGQVMRPN